MAGWLAQLGNSSCSHIRLQCSFSYLKHEMHPDLAVYAISPGVALAVAVGTFETTMDDWPNIVGVHPFWVHSSYALLTFLVDLHDSDVRSSIILLAVFNFFLSPVILMLNPQSSEIIICLYVTLLTVRTRLYCKDQVYNYQWKWDNIVQMVQTK